MDKMTAKLTWSQIYMEHMEIHVYSSCTIEPNLIQHTWVFDVLTALLTKMWEAGFCEPLIPVYQTKFQKTITPNFTFYTYI